MKSCLLLAALAVGGPRELRIRALAETPLPFVTTCVAPAARLAAVNDAAGVLAVAHRPGGAVHVSIVRLDEQGQVAAGEPVALTLPKPATLADRPSHVLGMVCHPRFPLLYVWQDVAPPEPAGTTIDPARSAEFDHLLVYGLDELPPRLLLAAARGDGFHCGALSGGFALNATASRLFLPNMQQPDAMKKPIPAIGWIRLAPDGLPVFETAAPAKSVGAVSTSPTLAGAPSSPAVALAPAEAAASRVARLAQLAAAQASAMPLALSMYREAAMPTFSDWPSPYSYAPVGDDIVLMAGVSGPVHWELSDRLGRFGGFFFSPYVPYRYRLSAHPSLPSAYVTLVAYDGRIVRMEHADGYFTLTPQTVWLEGLVIHSPPLVLTKTNQVAVGATGRICLVDLDDQGRFKPNGTQMTVNNPQVEAMAWSERFGRLYVPVEKPP
jgi:hypothetical protein